MKKLNSDNNLFLAIESSGETCAVGLAETDRVLMEISANIPHIHSRKLARFIDETMQTTNRRLQELSAVFLAAGPGSFTGLRIGYAIAKGIAHPLNISLIEIPSLDILAYQVNTSEGQIMPLIDAHRGEIFCAFYENSTARFKRLTDYRLIPISELPGLIKKPTVIVGKNASQLLSDIQTQLPDFITILSDWQAVPGIQTLVTLGCKKFLSGDFSDLESCEPMYMRKFKGQT